MIPLLFYGLIGGIFSLAGGLVLLWKPEVTRKLTIPLLSFAAGAFLSAALLDILPEALETSPHTQTTLIFTSLGFAAYFILERSLMTYVFKHQNHAESHSDHTETLPVLLILGDSFHNFLDGVVIALAYVSNPALGLVTTLAVAAHEIPQEIGDFGVLLHRKWDKTAIIAINIFQSLFTLPGVLLGYFAGSTLSPYLSYILASTAGIFVYLSASDLIPEIHHHAGHRTFFNAVAPFITSMLLVGYLTYLAHL